MKIRFGGLLTVKPAALPLHYLVGWRMSSARQPASQRFGIHMNFSFDPASVSLRKGHFIGGRYLDVPSGMDMHRPSDGAAFAHCPIADAGVVDQAVATAKEAVRTSGWAACRPRERVKVLHRWADLLEAEAETMGRLEALASTRPISQVHEIDIPATAEQIRFFAEMADKEGGDLAPTATDQLGLIAPEPYGVVGAITPWNFPLSMAGWKLGPALAAGNAVVVKPSEMTPFSTLFLAELAERAGLPTGLLNVVLGDGPTTGAAITGHPDIAKVSFTGSTAAGRAIMQNISRNGVKPLTLELGGKSPQIVFADADVELAADCIARGILANAGQVCVAASRILVHCSIADALAEALVGHMKRVRPGLTWDGDADYSPIVSRRQIDRISDIVSTAQEQGASARQGGRQMDRPGYYFEPTLLEGVSQNSIAVTEEIFGPVVTLQMFSTEDEALQLADHPTYGLSAGVFTKDLSRALRVVKSLSAGTVWVNRYGRSRDHILPTGGFKNSGIGKDLGREAFSANQRRKTVLFDIV